MGNVVAHPALTGAATCMDDLGSLHPTPLPERIVMAVFVPIALWNVMAQVWVTAGFSFRTLSLVYSGILVCLATVCLARLIGRPICPGPSSRNHLGHLYILAALCVIGAFLSVLAVIPAWDDAIYIGGRAVYFMEFDTVPMDLNYHHHGLLDFPIYYPLELAQTTHLLWGFVAYMLGVSCLDVFHIFVPFLGGLLVPVAHYLALSRFSRDRWITIVGVTAIFAFLCINGGTPASFRTFGNWAFVIWFGKSILISIVLPLFVAFSVDWFRQANRRNWVKLCVLVVVSSGLSGSAAFMLPLLAVALAMGHIAERSLYPDLWRKLLGYFSTLTYLVVLAVYIKLSLIGPAIRHLGFEYGFPDDFWGQAKLVFGGPLHLTTVAFVVSVAVTILVGSPVQRRFIGAWLATLIVTALNPLMIDYVATYGTTLSAYWRLFFLLPFPLALGIAVTRIPLIREAVSPRRAAATCCVLLLAALAINIVDRHRDMEDRTAVFSRCSFDFLAHKVRWELECDTRDIIEAGVPGVMIAPRWYSALIPLYTNDFPQVGVRHFLLMYASVAHGRRAEAESKIRAIRYLSGASLDGRSDLERLLRNEELKNVVVAAKMRDSEALRDLLTRYGFRERIDKPRFVLYVRG